MDATLEVAVPGEHRHADDVARAHRLGDLGTQRPGVADARRAAIAHHVEADPFEIGQQPGLAQIVGHDPRAGREAGLYPRAGREAERARLARKQPRADEHGGIRGVGAARDRGDQHRTIAELELGAARGNLRATGGLRVPGVALLDHFREARVVGRLGRAQRHPVLRSLGSREARLDAREIELEHVGVLGLAHAVRAPHPLRAGIGLDQRDLLFATAGERQIAAGLLVDREDRAGAAELGRHVRDRRAIGERQAGETVAEELDELVDDALLAQHLSDREHEIGRGRTRRQRALEPEADHLRDEHRYRLAQHRGFRLDAADAPAEHAQAR